MRGVRLQAAAAAALILAGACAALVRADDAAVVRESGTTNLLPLVTKAAEAFMAAHPGVKVTVAGTSSGEGISLIKAGSIDVAASDVPVHDESLDDTVIGTLGFAFVTGPGTGVTNLTHAQVVRIFSGKIVNWKQLGGNDVPIVLIERQIGTGTRYVFEMKIAKTTVPVKIADTAQSDAEAVNKTPGALSYVASYYTKYVDAPPLSYEGVAPTDENVGSRRYAFWTDEHLYSRKEADPNVTAFTSYVKGDAALLKSFGVVPGP